MRHSRIVVGALAALVALALAVVAAAASSSYSTAKLSAFVIGAVVAVSIAVDLIAVG